MKIIIEELSELNDTEIRIRCPKITDEIEAIIAGLRLYNKTISGKQNDSIHIVDFKDILYFDTVDRRTFFYTAKGVFETPLKLYQIEEKISGTSFVRVSKSCILNLKKVIQIDSKIGGKLIAKLVTGEQLEISRMYVPDIRNKLEI